MNGYFSRLMNSSGIVFRDSGSHSPDETLPVGSSVEKSEFSEQEGTGEQSSAIYSDKEESQGKFEKSLKHSGNSDTVEHNTKPNLPVEAKGTGKNDVWHVAHIPAKEKIISDSITNQEIGNTSANEQSRQTKYLHDSLPINGKIKRLDDSENLEKNTSTGIAGVSIPLNSQKLISNNIRPHAEARNDQADLVSGKSNSPVRSSRSARESKSSEDKPVTYSQVREWVAEQVEPRQMVHPHRDASDSISEIDMHDNNQHTAWNEISAKSIFESRAERKESQADLGDLNISIGTIEIQIEDPPLKVIPKRAASENPRGRKTPFDSSSRLERRYLI